MYWSSSVNMDLTGIAPTTKALKHGGSEGQSVLNIKVRQNALIGEIDMRQDACTRNAIREQVLKKDSKPTRI